MKEKEHNTSKIVSYPLKFNKKQKLFLPVGALPLSVSLVKDKLVLNVIEVIGEKEKEEFRIDINSSGEITTYRPGSTFVGTVNVAWDSKAYILHVFYSHSEDNTLNEQESLRA